MVFEEILLAVSGVKALEYVASALSIAGAELVSRKSEKGKWGWAIWLCANLVFIAFAYFSELWGLLVMQLWFTKTSIKGIRTHLLPSLNRTK